MLWEGARANTCRLRLQDDQSTPGAHKGLNPLQTSRNLLGFFGEGLWSPSCADVVGKGGGREGLAPGRVRTEERRSPCATIPWDSILRREVQRVSQGRGTPGLMPGAVSGAQGLDKGQSFGVGARAGRPLWDSRWERMKTHLGWGFVALAGRWGFGWARHPWVASCSRRGEGTSPLLPRCPPPPKERGRRGGCEPGERGRQKEAKPKRWKVTI